jgi:hypothetical protein
MPKQDDWPSSRHSWAICLRPLFGSSRWISEKHKKTAPEVSVKTKVSGERQTGSLSGVQPGSPRKSSIVHPGKHKAKFWPFDGTLPLCAQQPGSLFGVGPAPLPALTTQDPVDKCAKSKDEQLATSDRQIGYDEAEMAKLLRNSQLGQPTWKPRFWTLRLLPMLQQKQLLYVKTQLFMGSQ